MRLTLFDLDHTLLSGDSDVLWCDYLMERGLLDKQEFAARNADMATRYKAGTVGLQEFADFYVGTLAGLTLDQWEPVRREFLDRWIVPRIPQGARDLVQEHLEAGDLVLMTTATNRFITELTAAHFGIEHLLATEAERSGAGFSGRTEGTLNMREGKVARLHAWLAARGQALLQFNSTAYSDSINDLPLLRAVKHPVMVDPDPQLAAIGRDAGWPMLSLH
ncbi:HAD family phosphatase [uncultured Ramlibacter sp.]|uniref:HAD family hydrolase n=1 Tax=uncultured Ramlibacter sp. TaxID=260755 RepID=UPI00261ECFF4|nr:HAD-IB family hydrolase [uncultured Ramlibacter sp.]